VDANAYARQLKQLLPQGSLFALELDSVLSDLLLGISDELARVDGRCEDLVNEWDPRTADQTLGDWERVLDITPPEGATDASRRLMVAARVIAQGGQHATYFISVAASLGFSVEITVTDTHVWTMTVDLSASTSEFGVEHYEFRAGAGRSGDRLQSWRIPQLEDVINRIKPAHTRVLFQYVA
jgi:uncharacterized protein YmfQ (DUF2313 family)